MASEQKCLTEERHKYSSEQRDTHGVGAMTPEFFSFAHSDCRTRSGRKVSVRLTGYQPALVPFFILHSAFCIRPHTRSSSPFGKSHRSVIRSWVSHFSQSRAAMQPVPAAVTAWR